MFGASFPRLDFTTNLAGGDMHGRRDRAVREPRPGGRSPATRSVEGDLNGAVDVETTIRDYASGVTVDSIDVAGRVNLGNSTVARAGDRHGGDRRQLCEPRGPADAGCPIAGPDLNVSGQGTIALNDTGASNLTLHADTPSLDRIGEIIGQPLKGAAVVDATVTGNARELQAQGHAEGQQHRPRRQRGAEPDERLHRRRFPS